MTIEMKLSSIYNAAHVELPDQATDYSINASNISDAVETAVAEVALAGNHPLGDDLGLLGEELFVGLRSVTKTMNDSATALDLIAGDFAETDADAATWLQNHKKWLDNHPGLGEGPQTPSLPDAPKI